MRKEWQCRVLARVERSGHSPALLLEVHVQGTWRSQLDITLKKEKKRYLLDIEILVPVILRINIKMYPNEIIQKYSLSVYFGIMYD